MLPNLFPEIPYNSASVTCVGYRKADVPKELPGFGFLVPRVERKDISACTWVSRKFNHRVPADKVLLRLFTTGAKADVLGEVREKLGIAADPLFMIENNWPQSMPQYNVGHGEIVKIIEGMVKDLPGSASCRQCLLRDWHARLHQNGQAGGRPDRRLSHVSLFHGTIQAGRLFYGNPVSDRWRRGQAINIPQGGV